MDTLRVAYVAPEIPGPSSTFVYNEILEIEKNNIEVDAFSVHTVQTTGKSKKIEHLKSRCEYLYSVSLSSLLNAHFRIAGGLTRAYIKALGMCFRDSFSCYREPKIAFGIIYRFLHSVYLAKKLKENSIQHIHCHFSHIATDIAMYAAVIADIPFSFTAHANDIFQRAYLMKEKSSRAKFIATISNYNIEYLHRRGVPKDKLVLVRCGVNTDDFFPKNIKSKQRKPATLGFLGRLVEKKGVDILLDAVKILKDEGVELELQVMGDGPLEKTLRDQAYQLGIKNLVYFGGAIPHAKVSEWFGSIDYFVFSGKRDKYGDMDGIPVVLMEAMMRGVPVIATSVSGIPELIKANETGRLAKPDAQSFADEMKAALSEDSKERSTRIDNAIELVRTEYNTAGNAKILLKQFLNARETTACQTSLPT